MHRPASPRAASALCAAIHCRLPAVAQQLAAAGNQALPKQLVLRARGSEVEWTLELGAPKKDGFSLPVSQDAVRGAAVLGATEHTGLHIITPPAPSCTRPLLRGGSPTAHPPALPSSLQRSTRRPLRC